MDRISAFMDGETTPIEARQVILHLKQNEQCCETWKTFHLIGDVLRGDPILRDDFTARIRSLMQQEPAALVPRFIWRKTTHLALSAAASLAAVSVILTLVLTDNPLKPQPQLAVAPKPEATLITQTVAPPQPLPAANRNGFNEYLMAHQEYSPSTALQGVAPYVRIVPAKHDRSDR